MKWQHKTYLIAFGYYFVPWWVTGLATLNLLQQMSKTEDDQLPKNSLEANDS